MEARVAESQAPAAPPDFSKLGPNEIGQFLEESRAELGRIRVRMEAAHETALKREVRWIAHFDKVMKKLEDEAGDGKLPGEEKCIGIARRAEGGQELWEEWRGAERRAKMIDKVAGLVKEQISACQSEAKILRETEG